MEMKEDSGPGIRRYENDILSKVMMYQETQTLGSPNLVPSIYKVEPPPFYSRECAIDQSVLDGCYETDVSINVPTKRNVLLSSLAFTHCEAPLFESMATSLKFIHQVKLGRASCVTILCDSILCDHPVTASCVTILCDSILCDHPVAASCVTILCDSILCDHPVAASCVTILCDSILCDHPVTASCVTIL
ncbi:hypothetical protein STEG23_013008 [Scotinomys teguina]